jgi:hypothetical protein
VCHQLGAWHQAEVGSSISTSVNAVAKEEREREKTTIDILTKTFTTKDKWGKVPNETSTQFIKRLERDLEFCGETVPKTAWYRVFSYVISTEPIHVSEWVSRNITDKKLDWVSAKSAFIKEYTPVDEKLRIAENYRACRQYEHDKRERCGEYGQRFMHLAEQHGVKLDAETTLQDFQKGLSFSMQQVLLEHINHTQIQNKDYKITTLEEMIRVVKLLERPRLKIGSGYDDQSGKDNKFKRMNNNLSTSTSGFKKLEVSNYSKKVCIHHPGSSNHSTEECIKGKTLGNNNKIVQPIIATSTVLGPHIASSRTSTQTGASGISSAQSGTSVKPFNFACHNCGVIGHKAADCKVTKRGNMYTANNNTTMMTSKSPTSSNNNNTSYRAHPPPQQQQSPHKKVKEKK